jgi:hypothetical protein
MGRSIPTVEPAVSYPSLIADTSLRLQQLVNGWRGAERGEPLTALHNACVNAVGLGGRHLLPAHVLLVADLDATKLQAALNNLIGRGLAPSLRFRVKPGGCFDAVLVPARSGGDVPDRWLLVIEETLVLRDQVALYAHALGHLLLNREQEKMGRLPQLDPRAVIAPLQAKRELRSPRILLTLATGTGKTKIALQLIWKLKRARSNHNVLYLTDCDWLSSQAMHG